MAIQVAPLNLKGYPNLTRTNPKSDLFKINKFDHVEFWCNDATNTSLRFSNGFGMPLVAKSDISTGNHTHASYLLRSENLKFLFTAPYPDTLSSSTASSAIPSFDYGTHLSFVTAHGLGVRAVGLEVEDAKAAFDASVAAGAHPVAEPVILGDNGGVSTLAEVQLHGDVVLRYVSHANTTKLMNNFLPKFVPVKGGSMVDSFGLVRLDHVALIAPELASAYDYFTKITGYHNFVEYGAEDMLGLTETAVKTIFMANNNESAVINFSEPVYGTKQNSYAETFLKYNQGSGVQHLALASKDIFKTLKEMKKRSNAGGFDFMPPPPAEYYRGMKEWVGDVLTDEQIRECEKLSIKVDRDDEGVVLQTFTAPVGDRPTLIIEILQRIGCVVEGEEDGKAYQKPGCGGFGKNNVKRLVKSVEDFEKSLGISNSRLISNSA